MKRISYDVRVQLLIDFFLRNSTHMIKTEVENQEKNEVCILSFFVFAHNMHLNWDF